MGNKNVVSVNSETWESEVINSKIPVLVDFWANWCGPCKVLAPILDQLAIELKDKIKFVSVDVESDMQLATDNSIQSIPRLVLFVEGKKTSDRMIGLMSKDTIKKILEKYIEEN